MTVCPATDRNPRNSEGDIVELKDGNLLLGYTDFYHGAGHDMSPARISGKISRDSGKKWCAPFTLQENIGRENVMETDLLRLRSGAILLFFCAKNSEADCKPYVKKSLDEGQSWKEPVAVDRFFGGYVTLNNDRAIQLSTGRIILPCGWTPNIYAYPRVESFCFFSDDDGRTWSRSRNLIGLTQSSQGADEPGAVELKNGAIMMWFRTTLGYVYKSYSEDRGETWKRPESMKVVSPDAPQNIKRIPDSTDLLMVWNSGKCPKRNVLTTAISKDDGKTWKYKRNIETEEKFGYSYASITFIKDMVMLTYLVYSADNSRTSLKLKTVPVEWLYNG